MLGREQTCTSEGVYVKETPKGAYVIRVWVVRYTANVIYSVTLPLTECSSNGFGGGDGRARAMEE